MLDNYDSRTKLTFIAILLVLIIGITLLSNYNYSRSRDVQLVANARVLATALEQYYSRYNAYPEFDKAYLNSLDLISDQGANQKGEVTYYNNKIDWPKDTTLAIQKDDYQIDFTIHNSWPVWGITKLGGGRCRLSKNAVLQCVDL